jgi:hypothetical protein
METIGTGTTRSACRQHTESSRRQYLTAEREALLLLCLSAANLPLRPPQHARLRRRVWTTASNPLLHLHCEPSHAAIRILHTQAAASPDLASLLSRLCCSPHVIVASHAILATCLDDATHPRACYSCTSPRRRSPILFVHVNVCQVGISQIRILFQKRHPCFQEFAAPEVDVSSRLVRPHPATRYVRRARMCVLQHAMHGFRVLRLTQHDRKQLALLGLPRFRHGPRATAWVTEKVRREG